MITKGLKKTGQDFFVAPRALLNLYYVFKFSVFPSVPFIKREK